MPLKYYPFRHALDKKGPQSHHEYLLIFILLLGKIQLGKLRMPVILYLRAFLVFYLLIREEEEVCGLIIRDGLILLLT